MFYRALALTVFVVLLAACGGGEELGGSETVTLTPTTPTAPPTQTSEPFVSGRLSLEEFGVWCAQFEDWPEPKTFDDTVDRMGRIVDEAGRVEPPEEVERYFQAWLKGIKAVGAFASEQPPSAPMNFVALTLDQDYRAAAEELRIIRESMPSYVYDHVADCF